MTNPASSLHQRVAQRVAPSQRHTRRRPCPVCGGGHDDPRGRGIRCDGFTSADGRYARCSREQHAGALQPDPDGRHYLHRLDIPCACGQHHSSHNSAASRNAPTTSRPPRRFPHHGDLPTSAGLGYTLAGAYTYHTRTGATAYEVRRFERPSPTDGPTGSPSDRPAKLFRQYTPHPDSSWIEALDAPRVLYHLGDLLSAPLATPIYICEGEKAADHLRAALAAAALPGVATTTLGGSSAGHLTPLQPLRRRRVVILPDHDANGQKYATVIAQRARTAGAQVVVTLNLHGLPEKGDVVEWLQAGHDARELVTLAETLLTDALAAQRTSVEEIAPPDAKRFELLGMTLSEVQPEQVRWFWRGYIPLGKVTTLDGDPGLGKSTLTAYLAACATTGAPLPDGTRCEPGGVVLLSAEDDAADTIRPRLDAAGADAHRVFLLQGLTAPDAEGQTHERDVYLPGDLPALEEAIHRIQARLVVIDPLMAFLSSDVNSHRDQDIRSALRPLTALASRTGAAILLVRHLNKATGGSALYRGGGSIGIIGAARSGLLVAPDPDDPDAGAPNGRRVLAVIKSNLGAAAPALTFRVVSAPNGVGMIAWEGETSRTANDLMSQPVGEEERTLADEAVDYLLAALSEGPRRIEEVRAEAPRELQGKPLRRAAQRLQVVKTRIGFGRGSHVEWSLPLTTGMATGNTARLAAPDSLDDSAIPGAGAIDALTTHRCPPNAIDAHQKEWASMVDVGAYGKKRDEHNDPRAPAHAICPATGDKHVTARLRTADGWLRCIECEQTLPIRAS